MSRTVEWVRNPASGEGVNELPDQFRSSQPARAASILGEQHAELARGLGGCGDFDAGNDSSYLPFGIVLPRRHVLSYPGACPTGGKTTGDLCLRPRAVSVRPFDGELRVQVSGGALLGCGKGQVGNQVIVPRLHDEHRVRCALSRNR
jgi:hypothetical protein